MRRTKQAALAVLVLLAASGCSVTRQDPDYVPPAPLPVLEQLRQAPLTDPATLGAGTDAVSFVTADHTVACSLTSARGTSINLPYEPNTFTAPGNAKLATVPVAHCELSAYPRPAAQDIADDCAGTGLGYLGGTALLTPDKAVYGECRSGVTAQEAEYGPKGSPTGPISQLAVLPEGGNVERNGLRCSAYDGGVACGNVSAQVAFFVSRDRYELIKGPGATPSAAAPKASKSP